MFIVVLSAVLGLMHLYVWKRLVKDTTRTGRARWMLTAVLIALATLLVATLIAAARLRAGRIGVVRVAGLPLVRPGRVPVPDAARAGAGPARAARLGEAEAAGATETITDARGDPRVTALNRRVFLARASAVAAGAASVEPGRGRRGQRARSAGPAAGAGAPAPARSGVQRVPDRRGVRHPPGPADGSRAHRADRAR